MPEEQLGRQFFAHPRLFIADCIRTASSLYGCIDPNGYIGKGERCIGCLVASRQQRHEQQEKQVLDIPFHLRSFYQFIQAYHKSTSSRPPFVHGTTVVFTWMLLGSVFDPPNRVILFSFRM